jgi:hypothetical protein
LNVSTEAAAHQIVCVGRRLDAHSRLGALVRRRAARAGRDSIGLRCYVSARSRLLGLSCTNFLQMLRPLLFTRGDLLFVITRTQQASQLSLRHNLLGCRH